jgi:hypothetical protein
MKQTLCLMIGLIAISFASVVNAQPANENIANGVIAARQKDAAMLQQYNWNCRTEITQDGKVQNIRIDLVTIGPDGQPQRTVLNDEKSQLPGLFLRKAMEKNQRKQTDEYLKGLSKLLDDYTLPSAGKVLVFITTAQVQPITTPEGKTLLQMTGNSVIVPSDTLTLTIDPATMQTTRMQVTTIYKDHAATTTATFNKSKSGVNHLQFADIEVPDLNLSMQLQNYDYVPND